MAATLQFKTSLDTTTDPVAQGILTLPLHKLANQNRLVLGAGPTIKIQIGENITVHDKVPKRAVMALSKAFNNVLTDHPRASIFRLNPDQVTEASVNTLVDFMIGNSKTVKPFKLRIKGLDFPDTINLYRHGLMFCMEPHVASLRASIIGRINDPKAPTISYNALNELAKLPVADDVYQAAVRNLEGLAHIGTFDKDEAWAPWVAEHQEFATEMARWKVAREARAAVRKAVQWERDFPPLA